MELSAADRLQPDPRRWQALALVCVAFFMTVLDVSIVNVALPSIKTSLHVSEDTLQWVLIAYTITFGGLPAPRRARCRPARAAAHVHGRDGRCSRPRRSSAASPARSAC